MTGNMQFECKADYFLFNAQQSVDHYWKGYEVSFIPTECIITKIKADVSTAILQSSSEDTQNAHKTLLIYKQSSIVIDIVIVDLFVHLSALCHCTMMSFWVYNVYMY